MSEGGSQRLTVSEDRLDLLLTKFKLELFQELTSTYATNAALNKVTGDWEKWRDGYEARFREHEDEVDGRFRPLEANALTTGEASKIKVALANAALLMAASSVGALLYYVVSLGGH